MRNHRLIPVPEVDTCITQTYQGDDGRWWRYCLTCDDGSNKYGKHRRGHKDEKAAMMSAKMHTRDATANRQWRAWFALWVKAIIAVDPEQEGWWERFTELYDERFQYIRHFPQINWANVPEEKRLKAMQDTQEVYRKGWSE